MVKLFNTNIKGFTLIELMIVIAIMSTVLTLVGPNLYKSYKKAQRQIDIIQLRENLKAISQKAFLNHRAVKVDLLANKIYYQYIDSKKPRLEKKYKHISFSTQSIFISSSGFIDQASINIISGEDTYSLSLNEINRL